MKKEVLLKNSMRFLDLISIEFRDELGSKEYESNKESSKRFHKIVSAKQIGPTIAYSGRLTVFGESNSKYFPYFGKFYSKAFKQEHKILIHKEAKLDALRQFNTAKIELNFLGAPGYSLGWNRTCDPPLRRVRPIINFYGVY